MNYLTGVSHDERSKAGIINKPKKIILTINTLFLLLFFSAALIMTSCSGHSSTANQTLAPVKTQTPMSSKSFKMSGSGMEPSLHDGDSVKAFDVYRDIKRGDIVVYAPPDNPTTLALKRIIGLPSETIEIKDSQVYINETILVEPYIKEPLSYSYKLTVIPEKSYFILGDNRNISADSHNYGVVPMANIKYIVETK